MEGIETSHRLDFALKEVVCLHRAVRNKPNQLQLAEEEQPKFGL